MRHESTLSPLRSFGDLENFLPPSLMCPITWPTCWSSASSCIRSVSCSCKRWYACLFPRRLLFNLSVQSCQFIGSFVRSSPARIRSPAASCTLTCKSLHCIATTTSRFNCSSCETPRSTEKWWVSTPVHHTRSSLKVRIEQITRMSTVHWPPRREAFVYDGLVLAMLASAH